RCIPSYRLTNGYWGLHYAALNAAPEPSVNQTAQMQVSHLKSLCGLDGSEKAFMERVRAPDAKFSILLRTFGFAIPIGFALLMIPFGVLPLLTEAMLGSQSFLTRVSHALSWYALMFLTFVFVLIFLGMTGLRIYVAWKLRKNKNGTEAA